MPKDDYDPNASNDRSKDPIQHIINKATEVLDRRDNEGPPPSDEEKKSAKRMLKFATDAWDQREADAYTKNPEGYKDEVAKDQNYANDDPNDKTDYVQKAVDRVLETKAKRVWDEEAQKYIKDWKMKKKNKR